MLDKDALIAYGRVMCANKYIGIIPEIKKK